jgi:WS/DGAT/MGAT family acyltransferase
MAHYKYDRLSAQDNDFLQWEDSSLPMHGGATQIFRAGPLAREGGGIDFETIKRGIRSILHKIPRYRQKLAWIPGEEHAVWVDDPHFNLDYHMRHIGLPRPGTEDQLKELAARIMERPLDRSRPLWEIWVVEGLQGGRFATVGKTHHCVVDGASGVDLAQNLMSLTPDYRIVDAPRFVPRPAPRAADLRRDEWARRIGAPWRALGEVRDFLRETEDVAGDLVTRARALAGLARFKALPASDTPLNGPVGPHRLTDWLRLSLADLKALRRARRCSVNDVVLAVVTGAVREFMVQRQVRPEELDFRVATPVNLRREDDQGRPGNRVSSWLLRLPVGQEDPLAQLDEIHRTTQELKESHQAAGVETVEALHEWLPIDLQSWSAGTQNMFVTNLPGPQFPLYLLGAELLEVFLQPPLIRNVGLVVGVISYNGRVCVGLYADYDRVPDLDDFAALVQQAFERLAAAAGVQLEGWAPESEQELSPAGKLRGASSEAPQTTGTHPSR